MKTNLDKFFKIEDDVAQEGVDFIINDTIRFKLRHLGVSNVKFKQAMAKHHKPFARQIDMGTLGEEKTLEVMAKVLFDGAIVSWEGVELDGVLVDCTMENAVKLFTGLPNLFEALFKHASDPANYRFASDDEDLGNS